MPAATPPCCWPSTSSGLSTVPQSSTATWRSRRTAPGVEVDLDDGDVGAERERRPVLVGTLLGRRASRARRSAAARAASSAHVSAEAGTPATPIVPRGRVDHDVGRRRPRAVDAARSAWPASTSATAARSTADPPICSDRDPPVPPPRGTRSVSPSTRVIRSTGMPVLVAGRASRTPSGGPVRATGCRRARSPSRRGAPRARRTRRRRRRR